MPTRSALDELKEELGDEFLGVAQSARRLPRILNDAELQDLLQAAEPEVRTAIQLLHTSGMRLPEMLGLVGGDLDLANKKVRLPDREAFYDGQTADLLTPFAGSPDRLFSFTAESFSQQFQAAASRSGLATTYEAVGRRCTWHSLRHHFGARLVDRGMDFLTLHRLMGHQFLQTTYLYVSSSVERYRPIYAKFGPFTDQRLPTTLPTQEQIHQLVQSAQGNSLDYLILRLFYASGIRLGELLALAGADVRPAQSALFIRSKKKEADRNVLIDPQTMSLLQAQVKGPGLIFNRSRSYVKKLVKRYVIASGLNQTFDPSIERFSVHSLRFAFATHCYQNGMDVYTIKALLGHGGLDSTKVYLEKALRDWGAQYDEQHELAREAGALTRSCPVWPAQDGAPPTFAKEWAAEFGAELPATDLSDLRLPRILTREEVRALLAAFTGDRLLWARLLYATGAFAEELAGAPINKKAGALTLGSGLRQRVVFLDANTLKLLDGCSHVPPPEPGDWLEQTASSLGISARYEAVDRKFTPNALRHACAVHCYENGTEIWMLHRLLGNWHVAVTELWTRAATKKAQEVYAQSGPFSKSPS